MKIMIVATAAESGGALSILQETYDDAKGYVDKGIQWIFILGKLRFEETKNITVFNFPWAKKSWFHRLFFDKIYAPLLAIHHNVDGVLSLQYQVLPFINTTQALNIHQSLPFAKHRFSFSENPHLWIYQNVIGMFIIRAIRKADVVFFPTRWIKQACVDKTKVDSDKIEVIPPRINVCIKGYFIPSETNRRTFFYPANGYAYKNHSLIVEACKKLKKPNIPLFRVLFTLRGNENKYIAGLFGEAQKLDLPIDFIGSLTKQKVFDYYQKSVLVFPSYIEAFGLPLLESRLHRGMILASETPFSHEILKGYENVQYFEPFDADTLAKLMESVIEGSLPYFVPTEGSIDYLAKQSVLERFVEIVNMQITHLK